MPKRIDIDPPRAQRLASMLIWRNHLLRQLERLDTEIRRQAEHYDLGPTPTYDPHMDSITDPTAPEPWIGPAPTHPTPTPTPTRAPVNDRVNDRVKDARFRSSGSDTIDDRVKD